MHNHTPLTSQLLLLRSVVVPTHPAPHTPDIPHTRHTTHPTHHTPPSHQAAGTIHTDFERGFICAEVMHYEELHELGNEQAVKAAGKYRQEGKNYTVLDGDVIFFK